MQYDADIIKSFAAKLYSQATSIVVVFTLFFGILGAVGAAAFMASVRNGFSPIVLGAGVLIGAAIGYSMGSTRAFRLKLEAQIALAQVEIEANTRRTP